jgi:DNA-binding NarL/FixJ family response regulator
MAVATRPALADPDERLDTEALEELVLLCVESLAHIAAADGERRRAARLFDAAGLLRHDPDRSRSAELTPREWDVAALVVRGCSNREIGAALVVSERTIDTHVSHILRKLGLVSRAQIAAWFVDHQRRFKVLS